MISIEYIESFDEEDRHGSVGLSSTKEIGSSFADLTLATPFAVSWPCLHRKRMRIALAK